MYTTLNIVMQIDESQHLSEERAIINYKDSVAENPDEVKTKIVNYDDMSAGDKTKYTALKDAMNALI